MNKNQKNEPGDLGRRDFVALPMAAGLAVASGAIVEGAALNVVESDVEIKTPDGVCDAAFVHPKDGMHAGVLLWPDAFGLRQATRDMAKRLAGQGYAVLVPNPFYRISKAPFKSAAEVNFQNPADMAKLRPMMASVGAPGNAEKDAAAYLAFLDAQSQVDKAKKIGVQGYCMGGPLMMRTAAALPGRVGAGASFHGGGLVTDKPESPHLLAPKIKAALYFGIAASDDARQPDARVKLKEALDAAGVHGDVEVYPETLHGWCMPDSTPQNGTPVYNKVEAERAWSKLLAFYQANL